MKSNSWKNWTVTVSTLSSRDRKGATPDLWPLFLMGLSHQWRRRNKTKNKNKNKKSRVRKKEKRRRWSRTKNWEEERRKKAKERRKRRKKHRRGRTATEREKRTKTTINKNNNWDPNKNQEDKNKQTNKKTKDHNKKGGEIQMGRRTTWIGFFKPKPVLGEKIHTPGIKETNGPLSQYSVFNWQIYSKQTNNSVVFKLAGNLWLQKRRSIVPKSCPRDPSTNPDKRENEMGWYGHHDVQKATAILSPSRSLQGNANVYREDLSQAETPRPARMSSTSSRLSNVYASPKKLVWTNPFQLQCVCEGTRSTNSCGLQCVYQETRWKELVSVTAWAYRRLEMWLQNPSPCLFRKSWWVADQMNLKLLHLCTLLGRKTISSCAKEKERLKGRLLFPVREKIKYFQCNVIRLKPNLASSGSTNHHGRFEIQAWRASTG